MEKPCEKCNYPLPGCEPECALLNPCPDYARYLGHQEGYAVGQSERDALRAEVEVMRRALDALAEKMQGQSMDCWRCPVDAYDDCFKGRDWRNPPDDWHGTCVTHMLAWAIAEARKGEG